MRETTPGQGEVDADIDDTVINLFVDRIEEVPRVRVFRGIEQLDDSGPLHDLSPVHDNNTITHLGDSGEVVGDEQHATPDLVDERSN